MTLVFICIMAFSIACRTGDPESQNGNNENASSMPSFGLITGLGGLGDRSYNDTLYKGMIQAKRLFGIEFDYVSPSHIDDNVPLMEKLISDGHNVIIAGGGWHQRTPVDMLARKHRDVIFVLIDEYAEEYLDNVCSIVFKQNEGSFLCGVLASMFSKTKNIAVIASTDEEVIRDFIEGFIAGAKYGYTGINILLRFIDEEHNEDDINPFNSPEIAYKIAENLILSKNVDIIYQVAAGSGFGVFNAVRDLGKYAIGVDSDQDYLAQGQILTSMMKNSDLGIVMIIDKILKGNFLNNAYELGIKENGVSLSPMTYTKHIIPEEILEAIDKAKLKIINEDITVPSSYKF